MEVVSVVVDFWTKSGRKNFQAKANGGWYEEEKEVWVIRWLM